MGGYNTMAKDTIISELLTMRQTCALLKVHPNTLRKWDEKGILKAVRFGQRKDRKYKKEDIEKLINTKNKQ